MNRRVLFYAPMKSPDHINPSGDRRMARLLMKALARGGWQPTLASRMRSHQRKPNPAAQDYLFQEAERIAGQLISQHKDAPPAVWFTYHCYYKAPDLIGPHVAKHFGIPYVVAEGYRAKKRLDGPYARFARAAAQALDHASVIYYLSERSLFALERDKPKGQELIHLPPFTALGEDPMPKVPDGPLKLVTVAMMRPGDKFESYELLAEAVSKLTCDWRLAVVGGGAEEREVRRLFRNVDDRVSFRGLIDNRDEIRALYEAADLMVWPGVNEAFGMVYLEAQAAGTPCVAQNRDGVREVVGPQGALTDVAGGAAAIARAIDGLAADRDALARSGDATRNYVRAQHGVNAASALITKSLESLL